MQMIQLYRPRLMAIAGTVTEVNLSGGTVKIKSYCAQTKSEKECLLRADRNIIASMHIKAGENIVATVKPSPELITLMDGGFDGTEVFRASVYNMRYTGSFDFAPRGDQPEQHIFRGYVKEKRPLSGGRTAIVLTWYKSRTEIKRNLIMRGTLPDDFNTSDPITFVTGPMTRTQKFEVYPVMSFDY